LKHSDHPGGFVHELRKAHRREYHGPEFVNTIPITDLTLLNYLPPEVYRMWYDIPLAP